MDQASLEVIPTTLRQANAYVSLYHRHHRPSKGHKFSMAVRTKPDRRLCGVAIVSKPRARALDTIDLRADEYTAEIVRVCTDGTPNACSKLYGACARACKAMGFSRVVTYTLLSESGSSLRAAGFKPAADVYGRNWSCETRPRVDEIEAQIEPKIRWELRFGAN